MTTPSKNELAVLLAKTLKRLLTPEDPPPRALSLEEIISWARTISENPAKAYKESPPFNHKVYGVMKLADVWSGYQSPTAYNGDTMDPGPMGWFCAQMGYGELTEAEIQERAEAVYDEQKESPPPLKKAKLRPNQKDKQEVQAIARAIWSEYPILNIGHLKGLPTIKKIIAKKYRDPDTVHKWLSELATEVNPRAHRGGRRSDETVAEQKRICEELEIKL
jgi:hypothetical protein